MIVATAGHVDHGKTRLVRALTGTDTDRAPESQARGMTIDLGFATARLGDGAEAVFIDVPGHERFIRNMLAGVAAIDLALLVVAADDGPMPQTREHLAILQLLGVPRLVVALTKVDRVDAARLAQATAEVRALLAGGERAWNAGPEATPGTGQGVGQGAKRGNANLAAAPVLPVAATTGQGVADLRDRLAAEAAALARRSDAGGFRLAIDRSFAIAGSGRVVTGAVLSGRLQVGDAVRLVPQDTVLRVRGLQLLGQAVDAVQAGQRCAVNLAGADLKRAEPARGDWLLAPDALPPADRLDVQLHWLPDVQPLPGPRAQLLLHIGAATRTVRWTALATSANGANGPPDPSRPMPARLVTDLPVHAAWGDRFILRDAAAGRTLAGGRVVDPCGPQRGRSRPQRLAQLAALAIDSPAASLQALLAASPDGADLARWARLRNLRDDEAQALFHTVPMQRLPDADGALAVAPARWHAWQGRVLDAIDAWHAARPDSLGLDAAGLRAALAGDRPAGAAAAEAGTTAGDHAQAVPDVAADIATDTAADAALLPPGLAALVADGSLRRDGLVWRRPGHRPVLPAADAALLDRVAGRITPDGLRPPIVGDLARDLGLPLADLLDGLGRLSARGLLVRVAPNRWYLPATVAQLEAEARALAADAGGRIDAAAYRDRTGIGRNLTVQVLEFLDRSGVTRFDGVHHLLRA